MAPGIPPALLPDLFTRADWLTLLEVSLTAIHVVTPLYAPTSRDLVDFSLDYLNPAGQRLTGLPERPAETVLTGFPPAVAPGLLAYYQRVFTSGELLTYQTATLGDGLAGCFEFSARRCQDFLLVSFRAIPALPPAPAEVAERKYPPSEPVQQLGQALQRLLVQAPVALAIFRGPQYLIELVNDMHLALWGRSREQVLGRPLFEAIPEAAGLGFEELLAGVATTGQPYVAHELSARLLRYGHWEDVYFNFVYQPLRDQDGRISGVVVVATEVTEQVRARQQVEQLNHALADRVQARTHEAQAAQYQAQVQRQRLERLFSQAPAAICILSGPALVYELVNPIYQQFFPDRHLLGKPLQEALPELADHAAYYTMRQVFDTGEAVWQQALHTPLARRQNGPLEDRYFNYIQQPRYDEQGHVDGVIVFGFEVTELVQARQQVEKLNQALAAMNEKLRATNEELKNSNTQLTRTNVELDNFIYTASHDLKAPISNIEGLLLALEHELPAAGRVGDVPAMLGMMQGSVERFQQTIQHLTAVSRLQQEPGQVSESVALAAVVEAVRLDLLPLLAQTRAQLEVVVPTSLHMTFSEKNLRSVIYNLLSNALKYHHPDRVPQVRLRYQPQHDYQVLEVQDNGLGLDLTQGQDKLFAMFQRLHTHVEGTGLGLYMVKKIVENAGGRIEVQSQLGQGTTFRVYLLP